MPATFEGLKLYTIGHSNHPIERFLDLLRKHEITALADVRSQPYSRFNPQFNQDRLRASLARVGIAYVYMGRELGARPSGTSAMENGRVSYELLAQRPEFQAGLGRVTEGAAKYRLALLCAEKDPIDCHRMILVAKHLRSPNAKIVHILADGTVESNESAERRLLERHKLQPNLFEDEAALIERAMRGKPRRSPSNRPQKQR